MSNWHVDDSEPLRIGMGKVRDRRILELDSS